MTKQETVIILVMLSAYYGEGKSDAEAMAAAWHAILKDFDFALAQQAVVNFARHDTRDYGSFPTPGKIVDAIESEKSKRYGVFNAILAKRPYRDLDPAYRELITSDRYENALTKTDTELMNGKTQFIQSLMPTETLAITGD